MTKARTLTWNDKLALINHYKPEDAVICTTFGVTQDELDTARAMCDSGTFTPTRDIDYKSYSTMFSIGDTVTSTTTTTKSTSTNVTTTSKPEVATELPQSATKKVKVPQKRGRKGSKISEAFIAIPLSPTNAEDFASTNGVSIAVLRQSKRFDKSPELGLVKVKKDKDSGNLMIWREPTDEKSI